VLDPLVGALLDGRRDPSERLDGGRQLARRGGGGERGGGGVERDEGREERDGGGCGEVRGGERLLLLELGDERREEGVLRAR